MKNLKEKGLILVYGIPGSGKSYFSSEIIKLLSKFQKQMVIYFELDELELFCHQTKLDENDFLNFFELFLKKNQKNNQNLTLKDFFLIIKEEEKLNSNNKNEIQTHIINNNLENYFFDNKIWKLSRDFSLKLVEKTIDLILKTETNFFLILDDNFLLKSMRKKYYQLCNK